MVLTVWNSRVTPTVVVFSCSEKVSRVLLMMADEQREVAAMSRGNIAVAVGMKNVSLNS